jgi:hypothetical protein
MRNDAPFSRNSSNCVASSLRSSDSGPLCFNKARMYSASAVGSASHLEGKNEGSKDV